MEIAGDIKLSLAMLEFHRQYFGSRSPEAAQSVSLGNSLISLEAPACLSLQVKGKLHGSLGLCHSVIGWLLPNCLPVRVALHRMCQGLDVLHRTLIASARCAYWLQSATGLGLDHQFHCPCGTPKWVKTRLAASLRQGLMVILSAKSIHA